MLCVYEETVEYGITSTLFDLIVDLTLNLKMYIHITVKFAQSLVIKHLKLNAISKKLKLQVMPTWNMLSSLLLALDDPPGLELSPLFGFMAGFSCTLGFFLFASKEQTNIYQILAPHCFHSKDAK